MSPQSPLILIVDDNKDILFHIGMILENNDYQIKTAKNGAKAIEILSELEKLPELIISDIMMPVMDGYELFIEVSSHPFWNRIPFIFLTAKTTPEDVRFGKMLGIDDYLTKPTLPEDLLAVIKGKIDRNRNTFLMDNKVKELLTNLDIRIDSSFTEEEKSKIILLLMEWNDVYGPVVNSYYSKTKDFPFSIKEVGVQLFFAANSIYGQGGITQAEGILLNIENIDQQGYAFFDSYPDNTMRAGEKQYMLVLIAPKITYMESLLIKNVFVEISQQIKQKVTWPIKEYYEKIIGILTNLAYSL
jgi:CheY-like chemotaxis protein